MFDKVDNVTFKDKPRFGAQADILMDISALDLNLPRKSWTIDELKRDSDTEGCQTTLTFRAAL